MSRIWRRFEQAMQEMYENPSLLRGSGLQTEVSFERHMIRHGIFSSRKIGYERYPNGPQRWPDFHVYDERTLLPIEIKSTQSNWIYLGQTWIHSEALYIVRQWQRSPSTSSVFLLNGRDMKTEEEDQAFKEFQFEHLQHKKKYTKHNTFISSTRWTTCLDIRYQLDASKRDIHYWRVMDDLRRL